VVQLGDKPSLFRSRYAAYQLLVRSERKIWDATGSVIIDTVPALTAEFAKHLGEFDWEDDTGATRKGADIRGHFFDLDAAAEENGWSDTDKELVRSALLRMCQIAPGDVWVHEAARIPAPWPTYDTTHHNKIPALAEELGLLDEAIAYESQNKNRESVIGALDERKRTAQVVQELTAA
jgi:hypothetical protein